MNNQIIVKVSVLCPTYGREDHGPKLYDVFNAQTYGNRELLILDDSATPSVFFQNLNDPNVRYHHTTSRLTVGAKRNWLAENARGEILAHFDDDDYYAPNYLTNMIGSMGDSDLVKLSSFYLFSVTHQAFAYWDLNQTAPVHFRLESTRPIEAFHTDKMESDERERWRIKNLLGYGFSCVYLKSLWQRVPFADTPHGEDFRFVEAAIEAGATVSMPLDLSGLALVLRHSADNSIVYPQYHLPPHTLERIFGDKGKKFSGYMGP